MVANPAGATRAVTMEYTAIALVTATDQSPEKSISGITFRSKRAGDYSPESSVKEHLILHSCLLLSFFPQRNKSLFIYLFIVRFFCGFIILFG
jgi:hypothetical protein